MDSASGNGNIEVEVHSQRKDRSAWEETLLQALSAIERGHRESSPTSDDGLDINDLSLSDDSKLQGNSNTLCKFLQSLSCWKFLHFCLFCVICDVNVFFERWASYFF